MNNQELNNEANASIDIQLPTVSPEGSIEPADKREKDPVEISLGGEDTGRTPMAPEKAAGWALKADVGVPTNTVGVDNIANGLRIGDENPIRKALADHKAVEEQRYSLETLQQQLMTQQQGNMSYLDAQGIASLSDKVQNPRPLDASTVIEGQWAKTIVNEHTVKSGNAAMDENPFVAETLMSFFESGVTTRNINQSIQEKYGKKWADKSWGGTAIAFGEQAAPWYWQIQMSAGEEGGSLDQGTSLEQQVVHYNKLALQLPPEEYKKVLEERMDRYFTYDPLGAQDFLNKLTAYQSSDASVFSLLGLTDWATSGTVGAAARAVTGIARGAAVAGGTAALLASGPRGERMLSSVAKAAARVKGMTKKQAELFQTGRDLVNAEGTITPEMNAIKAAGGKADEVATEVGYQKYAERMNGVDRPDLTDDLYEAWKNDYAGIYNIPKLIGQSKLEGVVELARRVREQLESTANVFKNELMDAG